MELSDHQLLEVIEKSPLISIDLVVRDLDGRILLGRRINEPAKGMWFVPGGRIRKNENIDDAIVRISFSELGTEYNRPQARLIGVFEHKYNANFLERTNVGTHYVVLAYEVRPAAAPGRLPTNQHSEFRWYGKDDASSDHDVHRYVLPYFIESTGVDRAFESQYIVLNERRNSFNTLLWQTPVLSLTAQAFLFTIALGEDVPESGRRTAATLALMVSIASIQLLAKHRFNEVDHAKRLTQIEKERGLIKINEKRDVIISWNPETWLAKLPSYWIWSTMLFGFGIVALSIIIH